MNVDGLIVVDKPGGMTSHDVVSRIRRLAKTRRVGHGGTLDPMATGVLIIGVLVSMFTAITVTRTVLRLVVREDWARKASYYGVTEEEFLSRPIGRPAVRGEARGRV